jgi:hypothetical protein
LTKRKRCERQRTGSDSDAADCGEYREVARAGAEAADDGTISALIHIKAEFGH